MNFNKKRPLGKEQRLRCDISSRMELAGKPNRGGCSCMFQLWHWGVGESQLGGGGVGFQAFQEVCCSRRGR